MKEGMFGPEIVLFNYWRFFSGTWHFACQSCLFFRLMNLLIILRVSPPYVTVQEVEIRGVSFKRWSGMSVKLWHN